MGGGGEIMAGRGWWQQIYGWSWMIVGAGGEIMTGRGCWWQNYDWSWVVATKLWLVVGVVDGRRWSWVVLDGPTIY